MFAALSAAEKIPGHQILILDNNHKPGRKLAVTGNGRCNITNMEMNAEHYHGGNPHFVNNVLARFSNEDLLAWFRDLGTEFKTEEKGRVFPVTDQAGTILDLLTEQLKLKQIRIRTGSAVVSAVVKDSSFKVTTADKAVFHSRKFIIATGGMTYPQLGATADGYRLAQGFGHAAITPLPCLTGFESHEKALFDLQGVKVPAGVSALRNGKKVCASEDDVMFTHYGVSGPAIFDLSSLLVRELTPDNTELRLNFFPGKTPEEVEKKILSIWQAHPERETGNSLIGILPRKLVLVLLRNVLKLDVSTPAGGVSKPVRRELISMLTDLKVRLKGPLTFKDAQVTSGGVSTDSVDPKTMESKLCQGLFFAGEVLDINGDCGGYNLQFAFSSGRQAGLSGAGNS
jgi:predicted Rossmann fold flavoprotein